MTKTLKNSVINILLLILTYILPICVLKYYQDDYRNIDLIQKSVFLVLLCGSLLLVYINNKNRIQIKNLKWLWLAFEILGILGTIYSLIVLGLIFAFRRGIGF
jgi:predicted ferric reductase